VHESERTLAPFKACSYSVKRGVFRNIEYLEALKEALLTVELMETDHNVSEHFL
jgi:hypothetical protein